MGRNAVDAADAVASGSLLGGLEAGGSGGPEDVAALLERPGLRIERIVSHGQASPPGFWYDQAEHEWVLVVRGSAALSIEGESALRQMGPGDWLWLPARCRHRVEWTAGDEPTVWLAVFVPTGCPVR